MIYFFITLIKRNRSKRKSAYIEHDRYFRTKVLRRDFSRYHFERGWTFVETLISISIILLLTGTVSILAVRIINQSKVAAARSQISSFVIALQSYYIDNGEYPTKDQGLESLWKKPHLEPLPNNWRGPYIEKKIPFDPWNREYVYTRLGVNNLPFSIISYGADGKEGGEDEAKDIVSWDL